MPCVWNKTIEGIPASYINWTLSPQDNCHFWNGTFPGFNIENETRSKELYDEVLPKCIWMGVEDIDEEWLNENCEVEFVDKNIKYKCSENLEILR